MVDEESKSAKNLTLTQLLSFLSLMFYEWIIGKGFSSSVSLRLPPSPLEKAIKPYGFLS